jgi:hypothetical protein
MFKMPCVLVCALCGGPAGTVPPHSSHNSIQDILYIYTKLFNFVTAILIINISHNVWIVYNIFINNYTLDECTHHCITYSVTAHPDDGQARPKHAGATNWENIYISFVHFVGFY